MEFMEEENKEHKLQSAGRMKYEENKGTVIDIMYDVSDVRLFGTGGV